MSSGVLNTVTVAVEMVACVCMPMPVDGDDSAIGVSSVSNRPTAPP